MPRKSSHISVTDQFCGAGGSSIGAEIAGAKLHLALNHWELAIETHNTNFPEALHDCTDISACDPRRYPSTDILLTSPECFPAGTLILTARGLISIESVKTGDYVLTHLGQWKRVVSTMSKTSETIVLKGQGHYGLETTPNHPFLSRDQGVVYRPNRRGKSQAYRSFGEPEWIEAQNLRLRRWATPTSYIHQLPIPNIPGRGMSFDNINFWWLVGRWLADGTARVREDHGGEIALSVGEAKANHVRSKLQLWYPTHNSRSQKDELRWRERTVRTAILFECGHVGMAQWLIDNFGKLAHGKTVPSWALTMPKEWRQSLLDGYLSGDGYVSARRTTATTVSKSLAVGIRLLSESLGNRTSLLMYPSRNDAIEGRSVNTRDQYVVAWETNKSERTAFDDGCHSWSLVKHSERGRDAVEVYNLSVEDDESYIADGIVVHNCTNHSLAKGKKRKYQAQLDLFGKVTVDPSEERSRATMWDVPRFAEFHDYRVIIVENVVDARHWRTWDAWLHAMQLLGYDHQIVYLNSMFAHVRPQPGHSLANGDYAPQSRDRMYVVFWKRGNKKPNLNINPVGHCHNCGRDVEAVQSWKRQKWGRYGKQYIYACPSCAKEVKPYYYAAYNAIDWSLPADRIGDRSRPLKERTLNRIRKGLEKFAGQGILVPLAYTHGHDDRAKSVYGSWPTQTGRQDIGLAYPPFIMNNQSDNRATGIEEPINTMLTGNHKYLVIPPHIVELRGTNAPKSMGDPFTTMVASGNHHGLVIPPYIVEMYGQSTVRSMEEALSTMTAGVIHHGMVVPPFLASYYGTDNMSGIDEAIPSVTTVDRHGVVIPPFFLGYANGDGPAHSVTDPLLTMHTGNSAGIVTHPLPDVDDCRFRMLVPDEVGRAMAFPSDYKVLGNNRDRVKQFGNAVTPPAMRLLMERVMETFQ